MNAVTLRQIARESQMSLAAVSLALRDSPKVGIEKRIMIREVAARLGYCPDPLVTAGMARIRARRSSTFQATLGWVNDHPDPDFWNQDPIFKMAVSRAQVLGYALDVIHLPDIRVKEPDVNVRRFWKIARARGIHGVLLPGLKRAHHALEEWPEMSAVVIGYVSGLLHTSKVPSRGLYPRLHNVVTDVFSNIRLAYDELHKRGYQRVGFVSTEFVNASVDNQARAAVLEMNELQNKHHPPVPLILSPDAAFDTFASWFEKTEPDAVLTMFYEVSDWLRRLKVRFPEDIGLAHTHLGPLEMGWSGIDARSSLVGAAAVDMLSAHLMRNERGTPPYPKRLSVPGVWVEGNTARHA